MSRGIKVERIATGAAGENIKDCDWEEAGFVGAMRDSGGVVGDVSVGEKGG